MTSAPFGSGGQYPGVGVSATTSLPLAGRFKS